MMDRTAGNGQVWRVTRSGGPRRPQPTTPIVRRGEDGGGRAAAGPAKLDHCRTTRRRVWVRRAAILFGIGLVTAILSSRVSLGQDTEMRPPASQATKKAAGTSSGSKDKDTQLLKKLDQILANQQTILQKFDAVMEELRIIKVRATPKS